MIVNINDVQPDIINLIKIWHVNNLKKLIITQINKCNNLHNMQKKIILSNDQHENNIKIE